MITKLLETHTQPQGGMSEHTSLIGSVAWEPLRRTEKMESLMFFKLKQYSLSAILQGVLAAYG